MEITAHYKINGGESQGYGLKYPLVYNEKKIFQANDKIEAYFEAMYQARLLAEDALSNPDTNKTVVTLLELYSQKEELNFKGKKDVVECSKAEHLLGCHYSKKEYYDLMGFTEEIKRIKEEKKKKRKYMRLESFLQ